MASTGVLLVCANCKRRKRACDKRIPSCTPCSKRALTCQYPSSLQLDSDSSAAPHTTRDSPNQQNISELVPAVKADLLLVHSVSDHAYLLPIDGFPRRNNATYNDVVHQRVSRLMQTTGLSVASIQRRYLDDIYVSFPIVVKEQLTSYQRAAVSPISLESGHSMLMLAMTLLVMNGSIGTRVTELADPDSFYLATKMLYAQVQILSSRSVALVQAGVLISMYEFWKGQGQTALLSIGACGLMIQSIISEAESNASKKTIAEPSRLAEMVWWCVLACERMIACNVCCKREQLVLKFPDSQTQLPADPDNEGAGESQGHKGNNELRLGNVHTSGRRLPSAIQAAWLVDRVLRFIELTGPTDELHDVALDLDEDLRTLLSTVLDTDVGYGGCCFAVSHITRAMLLFHQHIVDQAQDRPDLGEWRRTSTAALGSCARQAAEIARGYVDGTAFANIDAAPWSTYHVVRIARSILRTGDVDVVNGPHSSRSQSEMAQTLDRFIANVEDRWLASS